MYANSIETSSKRVRKSWVNLLTPGVGKREMYSLPSRLV